jgi:hypothetical protein
MLGGSTLYTSTNRNYAMKGAGAETKETLVGLSAPAQDIARLVWRGLSGGDNCDKTMESRRVKPKVWQIKPRARFY